MDKRYFRKKYCEILLIKNYVTDTFTDKNLDFCTRINDSCSNRTNLFNSFVDKFRVSLDSLSLEYFSDISDGEVCVSLSTVKCGIDVSLFTVPLPLNIIYYQDNRFQISQ